MSAFSSRDRSLNEVNRDRALLVRRPHPCSTPFSGPPPSCRFTVQERAEFTSIRNSQPLVIATVPSSCISYQSPVIDQETLMCCIRPIGASANCRSIAKADTTTQFPTKAVSSCTASPNVLLDPVVKHHPFAHISLCKEKTRAKKKNHVSHVLQRQSFCLSEKHCLRKPSHRTGHK